MSLATLARRVREQASWRRPRLVAKGDPEEAAVVAALHQEIAALPEGAVLLAEGAHLRPVPAAAEPCSYPGGRSRYTVFHWVKKSRATLPCSRLPLELSFIPPNGTWSSRPADSWLIFTTPARTSCANRSAAPRSRVNRLADRPYVVSLASATASSKPSAGSNTATGPKISSRTSRDEASRSAITVGSTK